MLSFETGCNLQCRFIPSENDISATFRQNINAKIYRMHENTFSRIVSSAISLRILHHTPYQSKGVESAQRSSIRPRADIGWWLIQSNCFILTIVTLKSNKILVYKIVFVFVLLCLGFYVPLENLSLIWTEASPLPVKGYKFWPIMGTDGQWAVKVL